MCRSLGLVFGVCGAMFLSACASSSKPAPEPREVREPRAQPEPGDPNRRAAVRLELAGLYFERGQLDTALDEVQQALQARPDLAPAHGLRGLILASLGQPAAAEQSLVKAIQLSPGDGNALHNHAWFLCQERRYALSEQQFNAALALPQYRDSVRSLLALGVCQARDGRLADAERSLSRSYQLDPTNPSTAFSLSQVLLRQGELERARFYIKRLNSVPTQVSAQSLWLAARVEHRLGNIEELQSLGQQLRQRYPQEPETLKFERRQFDD